MNIKTGLAHEDSGGHTMALFGKPRIRHQSDPIVYVDCQVIKVTDPQDIGENRFEIIELDPNDSWHQKCIKKMRKYAKQVAIADLQTKGWRLKSKRPYEYHRNGIWQGFYFDCEKIEWKI